MAIAEDPVAMSPKETARPMYRKLIGIPVSLAVALMATGCVEEIPKDLGKKKPTEARSQTAVEEVDTGPAANAPKADPRILDPKIEEAPTGKYGGTLFLPAYDDPKTFNPTLVSDSTSGRFLAYTFDGLVEENGITFEVEPVLAKSWEIAKDNKTYTVKLRRGVTWHDGKPFTADDVIFTWMTVLPNLDIPWPERDNLKVDNQLPVVTKIDDFTVQFKLARPFAPFLSGMALPILPKHIWGPWITTKAKDGKPVALTKWGVDAKITDIVGTGPWIFENYRPGERITLKRNPNYFRFNQHKQPLPYLDRISVPFLKTLDTAILKFKSGETDSQWMPGKDYAYMKPLEREGRFKIINAGPDFRTSYMAFNLHPGKNKDGKPFVDPVKLKWFQDRRFRQAVSHAINRGAIIKAIYRGLAVPQDSPVFQKSPFFDPTVPTVDFDLKKAAALLAEAGFVKKGDQLYDKDGHPVKFSFMHQVGSKEGEMETTMIKKDLAQLGIKIQTQGVTFNVHIARVHESKDWESHMGAWGAGVDPHGVNALWKSNGQYHFFNLNPQDQPIANPTYEWEKRKKIYNEFQHIVAKEQILIHLPVFFYTVAIRDNVGNAQPSAYSSLGSSWNSYELYKK
jgi:peptide/nickel transport system substrate-binding protein